MKPSSPTPSRWTGMTMTATTSSSPGGPPKIQPTLNLPQRLRGPRDRINNQKLRPARAWATIITVALATGNAL
ncbi:hypothetical protein BD309DRAFT_970844 [Dichomitus squalens]|nr:hypothetical protein BD309DRAFT_970844 [Dichomitus squalens]